MRLPMIALVTLLAPTLQASAPGGPCSSATDTDGDGLADRWVTYQYDEAGRVLVESEWVGDGPSTGRPPNLRLSRTYSEAGHLIAEERDGCPVQSCSADGTPDRRMTHQYDGEGRRIETREDAPATGAFGLTTFAYDRAGRLIETRHDDDGDGSPERIERHDYEDDHGPSRTDIVRGAAGRIEERVERVHAPDGSIWIETWDLEADGTADEAEATVITTSLSGQTVETVERTYEGTIRERVVRVLDDEGHPYGQIQMLYGSAPEPVMVPTGYSYACWRTDGPAVAEAAGNLVAAAAAALGRALDRPGPEESSAGMSRTRGHDTPADFRAVLAPTRAHVDRGPAMAALISRIEAAGGWAEWVEETASFLVLRGYLPPPLERASLDDLTAAGGLMAYSVDDDTVGRIFPDAGAVGPGVGRDSAHPDLLADDDEALRDFVADHRMPGRRWLLAVPRGDDPTLRALLVSPPGVPLAASEVVPTANPYGLFPILRISLTPRSARAFAELTRHQSGARVALVLDGRVLIAPVIENAIEDGVVDLHLGPDPPAGWLLEALDRLYETPGPALRVVSFGTLGSETRP